MELIKWFMISTVLGHAADKNFSILIFLALYKTILVIYLQPVGYVLVREATDHGNIYTLDLRKQQP